IDASEGRVALLALDHAIVIDRDGTRREIAVTIPTKLFLVRLSPSGDRIAALAFENVLEWSMTASFEPRRWARRSDALNGILYVGEQLYSWSNNGTGLVSLEPGQMIPRWVVPPKPNQPIFVATAADRAVLATAQGLLAYANPIGIVELVHRR